MEEVEDEEGEEGREGHAATAAFHEAVKPATQTKNR